MANPWFRLYAEFANDPKVQMLSETEQRRLVMLFCFRCNGHVTLQDEEVAFQLRISNDEWLSTKANFLSKGFINTTNEVLNWDKRQFVSDSSAARVAKHREKKKQECNVTVTPPDTDTDTESNADKPKTFTPLAALISLGVSKKIASDWLKIRKAKKQVLTETALDGVVSEAAKAGLSMDAAIKKCCENSWAGFKASWLTNESKPSQFQTKNERIAENNNKAIAEFVGETVIEGDVIHDPE
jgi:hypothetical protein